MYDRRTRAELAHCLARAFLAGAWEEEALVARADIALDPTARWARRIVRDVLAGYHRPPADRPRELGAYVERALDRHRPYSGELEVPQPRRWLTYEPAMARMRWPIPEIASVAALAQVLGLAGSELEWLADVRSLERVSGDERLRNYRYGSRPRRRGPPRVLECPKPRLKAIQRTLLHDLLVRIPAHEAAHGFTRGRSALTHARHHAGRTVVLSLDLEDFFTSIAAGRVYGIFRSVGYPESVAHVLTALTTNTVPPGIWYALRGPRDVDDGEAAFRLGRRLSSPHLPQGAPTSPALANLAAFGLDRRLHGLAGAIGCVYSRYADDITISGSLRGARRITRVRETIVEIAREEGFAVNQHKSRVVTRAGSQRVCGLVVNEQVNVPRTEYDALRAIVHNAGRHGPTSQNRAHVPDFRAHLLGRISWVARSNPARGRKLQGSFARIDWSGGR